MTLRAGDAPLDENMTISFGGDDDDDDDAASSLGGGGGGGGASGAYLPSASPFKFLDVNEWGVDKDVRRVMLQSGSLCAAALEGGGEGEGEGEDEGTECSKAGYSSSSSSSSSSSPSRGRCVSTGKAVVDTSFTPTETEKRYIFSVHDHARGVVKSVHVAVTMNPDTHDVFIQALAAGELKHACAGDSSKEESYKCDVNAIEDLPSSWNKDGNVSLSQAARVGFIKYMLAPEMVRSLRGV